MAATATARRRKALTGAPRPRIAPPVPARTGVKAFRETAASLGIELWPWQVEAARYLTALGQGESPLYREVAIVVARQNGKTELLLPLIVQRLIAGKRVMHTAQNRELPRLVHRRLAMLLRKHYPDDIDAIRRGAGQEEIWTKRGGHYRIVAPNDDGARGSTNDLVIVDELRQMVTHDFIAAAKPTLAGDAQIVYLSNAGTADSVVLNALRDRATGDPRLAYLEWSAAPDRATDDEAGWLEANPAIGHKEGHLDGLRDDYRAHLLSGTLAVFETEQLCRWVAAMDQRLVRDEEWDAQEFGDLGLPTRAVMAIKMDPSGDRVSAVVAWRAPDGRICLDVHDTKGPIEDRVALARDLQRIATVSRVATTTYDPYTDADLARHLRGKVEAIRPRDYGSASEKFVNLVGERRLRVNDPKAVIKADLAHTVRRPSPNGNGAYKAVRSGADQSNTAAEAAVMAAWLASDDSPTGPARLH